MSSFDEDMKEFKKQLEKGAVKSAYRGLMDYIMSLRTHFKNKYPDYFVSGSVYQGYMDMTYFSLVPESFKRRKLKIAVVFVYDTFTFEVWLAGYNKKVQTKYYNQIKKANWAKYRMPTTKGADSIIEQTLANNPNFNNLNELTKQIETGTAKFIEDVEKFLDKQ